MLSLFMSLCLMGSMGSAVAPDAFLSGISHELAIQEFDAYLHHWQKGQELQLSHPLFSLTKVSAGPTSLPTILFAGHTGGLPGSISIAFYTLDGDLVFTPPGFTPPGTVKTARVDAVAAVVPRLLIGRTGAIQVTFSGDDGRRAAYYMKAQF